MDPVRRQEIEAPAIVLAVGTATIVAAWGFEILGGYIPCPLCLQQRVPYYIGLPVVVAAVLAALAGARATVPRMLLIIAGLIFAYNVYLGIYHAGAEWAWWLGPADCASTGGAVTSVDDLLGQLNDVRVVSCTEVSWRLLGLSFAGWNAAISIVLVAISIWGAFRPLAGEPAGAGSPRASA